MEAAVFCIQQWADKHVFYWITVLLESNQYVNYKLVLLGKSKVKMFNFVVTGTVWSNLTDPEDCHIMMDIPNRSFQVLCSICANQCFLTDSQLQYMYLNCTLTSVAKYLMMFI